MRLIDADALTATLGITDMDCDKCAWGDKEWRCCKRGGDFEDACCAIENAPTIEPEQRWMPVTERMPEEDYCTGYGRQYSMDVLMTVHNSVDDETIVDYGHTIDGRWFSCTTDGYIPDNWSVLAWMPLPAPYKEKE